MPCAVPATMALSSSLARCRPPGLQPPRPDDATGLNSHYSVDK